MVQLIFILVIAVMTVAIATANILEQRWYTGAFVMAGMIVAPTLAWTFVEVRTEIHKRRAKKS